MINKMVQAAVVLDILMTLMISPSKLTDHSLLISYLK